MENNGEIVVYQPDEITRLEVMVGNETVWLTQSQLSALFQKDQSVIARHIKNVFSEGELDENSNMQILHNTLSKYKPVRVYSLDVIISVGYRVKSLRGTQFRRWANSILKEYLLKGYSINTRLNTLEDRIERSQGNSPWMPQGLTLIISFTISSLHPAPRPRQGPLRSECGF